MEKLLLQKQRRKPSFRTIINQSLLKKFDAVSRVKAFESKPKIYGNSLQVRSIK